MAKKAKSQPGVMLYFADFINIEKLSDDQLGKIFRATMTYGLRGAIPDFSFIENPVEREYFEVIWNFFKTAVERDWARYIKNKEVKMRANKIKFIKAHPELNLDCTNELDISCIVTDERTGKLVYDPEKAYKNETEGKDDAEFDYFPPQMEEAKRQQVERTLSSNPLGLSSGTFLQKDDEELERTREMARVRWEEYEKKKNLGLV